MSRLRRDDVAVRIVYQPPGLTFDEFHRVDKDCFPDEPVAPEGFATVVGQDFWAACDGEALVGYSYVLRKPDVAWLARIGVAGTHRRRAVATTIMRTIIEHCERIGLPDVMLYVQSDNVTALRLQNDGVGIPVHPVDS
jgi:ribosomal protein S18 acetylase RimI-like enzyme